MGTGYESINSVIFVAMAALFFWAVIASIWSKITKIDTTDKEARDAISKKSAMLLAGIIVIVGLSIWVHHMTNQQV